MSKLLDANVIVVNINGLTRKKVIYTIWESVNTKTLNRVSDVLHGIFLSKTSMLGGVVEQLKETKW